MGLMAYLRTYTKKDGTVTWYVCWREGGDGKQSSYPLIDHQSALNFKRLLEANGHQIGPTVALLEQIDRRSPTVTTLIVQHIAGLSGVLERTRADYRRDAARHIEPHLGHVPVNQVTQATVRYWVQDLAATDISDKTIANAHGLLSAAMTTAIEREYRVDNPCRGVRLPRRAEHETFSFTPDQWQAMRAELAQHMGGWYLPLYDTLIGTGMRWGEATALLVADLTLDGAAPCVRVTKAYKRNERSQAYVGTTKTRRSRRTIALPPSTAEMLLEHVQDKAPTDLVFPGPMGRPIHPSNSRARVWLPAVAALKAAGILSQDVNPRQHDLRGTYITWQFALGVDPLTVQHNAGHESMNTTTKVYASVLPAQAKAAAAALDTMLRG